MTRARDYGDARRSGARNETRTRDGRVGCIDRSLLYSIAFFILDYVRTTTVPERVW